MLPYEIEPEQLQTLLTGEAPPLVLDVREPWESEAAPFLPAVTMPMGEVPGRAHQELDPESRIVAVCHHGVRSLDVAAWLRREGFDQAQSLTGGTDAWSRSIDPLMPRY